MRKYSILVVLVFSFLGAAAQKLVVNDANAEARVIAGSFEIIDISGGIDLYLSQYDQEAVAVSATDDAHKDFIKTVVSNNTLKIYYEGPRKWGTGNKKLKVYVSFKKISKIRASGGCGIQVADAIQVPALVLNLNGASGFKGAVKVNTLSMVLSGASDVRINGTATEVSIQSSGASDVRGYDLITDLCNAKASGASDINITVNKELNASASGASDIYYKGDAIIKGNNTSGASSIIKKG